jgi:hypothetical protein
VPRLRASVSLDVGLWAVGARFSSEPRDRDWNLAGATGLEPATSCMTGTHSNLSGAACATVRENYRAKGGLFEKRRLIDSVLEFGDRAAF